MTLQLERPDVDDEARWNACLARDTSFDGAFIVAVRTTGIYCRPSCSARKPKRQNVSFFSGPAAAREAGYRACKRCHPDDVTNWTDGRPAIVEEACARLEAAAEDGLGVADVAGALGVSEDRLRRAFKGSLAMTPGEYLEARRLDRLKDGLREGKAVTAAMYDAGYNSSSRLYDGATRRMGMTPGAYARKGRGLRIAYRIVHSPIGLVLLAGTETGVCAVQIGDSADELTARLSSEFPLAEIGPDSGRLAAAAEQLREHLDGVRPRLDIRLDVQATAFQWRVWQALQAIAYGATKTYGQIAREIGFPKAARAVGRACAMNPVAIVVPCHRAVGSDGSLTGYAYGIERKQALLAKEAAVAGATASGRGAARGGRAVVGGAAPGAARGGTTSGRGAAQGGVVEAGGAAPGAAMGGTTSGRGAARGGRAAAGGAAPGVGVGAGPVESRAT